MEVRSPGCGSGGVGRLEHRLGHHIRDDLLQFWVGTGCGAARRRRLVAGSAARSARPLAATCAGLAGRRRGGHNAVRATAAGWTARHIRTGQLVTRSGSAHTQAHAHAHTAAARSPRTKSRISPCVTNLAVTGTAEMPSFWQGKKSARVTLGCAVASCALCGVIESSN